MQEKFDKTEWNQAEAKIRKYISSVQNNHQRTSENSINKANNIIDFGSYREEMHEQEQ